MRFNYVYKLLNRIYSLIADGCRYNFANSSLLIFTSNMNKFILKVWIFIFLVLHHFIGFSQQKFNVTIYWPKGLITKKMEIFYNTGIKEIKIVPRIDKNEIIISDSFISKKATIVILFDGNNYHLPTYNSFYVSQKKATIIFMSNLNSHLKSSVIIQTINAHNLSKISKEYKSFI